MDDIRQTFAANLRARRKALGLTQAALGAYFHYTEKTVSKWESGRSIPDAGILLRLSDILGTDLYALLGHAKTSVFYLGIDGGATGTRFALADKDGHILRQAMRGSSNAFDIGMDAAQSVLEGGIREVLSGISYADVCVFAGLSGGSSGENAPIFAEFFSRFGFRKAACRSDMANAVEVCLRGQNGIAVIAGTGSVICVMKDGVMHRIGGYGYLFDKGCCGYGIGASGFSAVLHAADGSGEKTALSASFEAKLGKTASAALGDIYRRGKTYIASFAPLVFEAYAAGDAVAESIVKGSASALAVQIAAGADMLIEKDRKAVIVGGMTAYEEILGRLLREKLGGIPVSFCHEEPIYGALRCAMRDKE